MADLTMETLGDWMRFGKDAFPVGFVSGRSGQLTPEAAIVAQASMDAAAKAAPPLESLGVDLPRGPLPGIYAVAEAVARDPWANPGVQAGPGCGPFMQMRTPFEVTQTDLDTTPLLERFAKGEVQPWLEAGEYPAVEFPELQPPLAGLRGFLGALGDALTDDKEAYDKVVSGTQSATEQARMGNVEAAQYAYNYAVNAFSAIRPTTREYFNDGARLLSLAAAEIQRAKPMNSAQVEAGRASFEARSVAAQRAAGLESERALREQDLRSKQWWNPANILDPSVRPDYSDTTAMITKAAVTLGLIGAGAWVISSFFRRR